jgi:hypothetical protein
MQAGPRLRGPAVRERGVQQLKPSPVEIELFGWKDLLQYVY